MYLHFLAATIRKGYNKGQITEWHLIDEIFSTTMDLNIIATALSKASEISKAKIPKTQGKQGQYGNISQAIGNDTLNNKKTTLQWASKTETLRHDRKEEL